MIRKLLKKIKEKGLVFAIVYYLFRFISKLNEKLVAIYISLFGKLNKNCIVFKNRQMQDYSDNARALFEYLYNNDYTNKYKIVWCVSEPRRLKKKKLSGVKIVKAESKFGYNSLSAYYYANTCGYYFYTNNTADLNRKHLSGQMVVNLWHGCGYKGQAGIRDLASRRATMEAFDYALVPGELFVDAKARYWECDEKKILPLGYPRYDWLLNKNIDKNFILNRLFGKEYSKKKMILWMPTFRKTKEAGNFKESEIELLYGLPLIENYTMLEKINSICEEYQCFMVIKIHPLQADLLNGLNFKNIFIIDNEILNNNDILLYNLIAVSDAMISDYSSVAIDYLLLDRPIGYTLSDYDLYKEKRGFIFDNAIEYMPGHKMYEFDDLICFMRDIAEGRDPFKAKREEIVKIAHNITDDYCLRILNELRIYKGDK